MADDSEIRFEAAGCAGGGAHALSLAFDSAEYALSALRGLSCIASGLAVTELSGHVYSGDAWGWWQISRMPPPTRWAASFTAGLAHKGISSAEGRAVPWGGPPFAWGDLHAGAAVRGDGATERTGKGARRGVAKGWPRPSARGVAEGRAKGQANGQVNGWQRGKQNGSRGAERGN